jgi:hypothetical protein
VNDAWSNFTMQTNMYEIKAYEQIRKYILTIPHKPNNKTR